MKRNIFFFSLLLFVSCSHPPKIDYSEARQQAHDIVQAFYEEKDLPGISISVYKDGDIIWSEGFGYADIANKVPSNPEVSLYRIGSVSKTFTSAGVGVLVQEGKLDLDKPVQEYVPYFPEKKYPITVKQVAGHIAGIRSYTGDEFMSNKKYNSVEEGIGIFKDDSLLFEPGTKYSYSSYGWNLMSAVVEGASGEEFLSFMDKHIFKPLSMNNTIPDHADQIIHNRVTFYMASDSGNVEAPPVNNSYKWAGGGFLSTTEDMITFGKAFLDTKFLNDSTQTILMAPLHTSDGKSTNYGIGWATIQNDSLGTWVGHAGGSVGGSTMFVMSKSKDMIIAYATNKSDVNNEGLHFKVADVFLKVKAK